MNVKQFLFTLLIVPLATLQPTVAIAGSDGIVGGIVGGLVGGAVSGHIIKKDMQKQQQQQQQQQSSQQVQTVYVADRSENRSIQNALNYFGFPAGAADGVLGRSSRNAISQYQVYMGFPVTGQLSQFEKDFLLNSHSKAQAGGFNTMQKVASMPDGSKGLLLEYRDEMTGGTAATAQPALFGAGSIPSQFQGSWKDSCSGESAQQLLIEASGFNDGVNSCSVSRVISSEGNLFSAEYACGTGESQSLHEVGLEVVGDKLITKSQDPSAGAMVFVYTRCE
jgi:hypothetical protein